VSEAPPRLVTLKDRLVELVAHNGPMTVAQYMAAALYDPMAGYYARHAMLGEAGDFITAPETSQMFGELVGLWCAQTWLEMGSPAPFQWIELGPGGGALMSDAWRAGRAAPGFRDAARLTLVEISPGLQGLQAEALAGAPAAWVTHLDAAPGGPQIIIGNEFLDCMPVRQFVKTRHGWRERLVGARDGALCFGLAPAGVDRDPLIPEGLRAAPEGVVAEVAPSLALFIDAVAARLKEHGGRALFIDYGGAVVTGGDTLQAVTRHRKVDPLADPGGADLTAHVDFAALVAHARTAGLDVAGPVSQGAWLRALGIERRAAALSVARPDKVDVIARQLRRLAGDDAMGALFQVVCLSSPGLPAPAGFAS
jgi:SAM-dependent MidA family methyltransferase